MVGFSNNQHGRDGNDQFYKALGLIRWNGEKPAWMELDIIERDRVIDQNDKNELIREIERLRTEKAELASFLEKLQTMLSTQQEIEQQKDEIHDNEMKRVQLQLKQISHRNEEL